MKKSLRNFLALALGFVTVIATAQSWDADSRTRVDMGGDNDKFMTEQRISLGASWGGNGWGINVSGNANYGLGGDSLDLSWNEAYATTDLMGYATVAVGRQALEYGNGQLIGANDWAANPNTRDGGVFTINNDMMDIDFGLYKNNGGAEGEEGTDDYFINASKSDGDWTVNLTYISNTDESSAMGLDFGYAMMDGNLDLDVSYNTATSADGTDMDYTAIGATYNVNDNVSVSATRTTYGENGFMWAGSNMDGDWMSHGNMGYLGADDEDMALGLSYGSGDFTLGVAVHNITDANDEAYERNVTAVNFDYNMSDNANVGIKYATDNNGTAEDTKYMWLTLSVTP